MRRTILVGDVHGCLDELEDLLKTVELGAADEVILVGDLVAKGPDSQGVVQLARERGFKAVQGNHDAHVLRIREGTLNKAPKPTHQRVADALTDADWRWLAALPVHLRLEELGTLVVHAGVVPGVPLESQQRDHLLNLRSITPAGEPSKRFEDGKPWASLWTGPEHVVFGHDAVRGLQRHPFATGLDTGCVYGKALTALVLPERRLVSVPAHRVYSSLGS
ncbi:MAG: metallophosphoesterase [Myxococcaceae bacterium]